MALRAQLTPQLWWLRPPRALCSIFLHKASRGDPRVLRSYSQSCLAFCCPSVAASLPAVSQLPYADRQGEALGRLSALHTCSPQCALLVHTQRGCPRRCGRGGGSVSAEAVRTQKGRAAQQAASREPSLPTASARVRSTSHPAQVARVLRCMDGRVHRDRRGCGPPAGRPSFPGKPLFPLPPHLTARGLNLVFSPARSAESSLYFSPRVLPSRSFKISPRCPRLLPLTLLLLAPRASSRSNRSIFSI